MEQFILHSKNLKQNVNQIEAIQILSELAIYGDKKDQDVFDHFIEEKILDEFVRVLKITKDNNIVNQILQSIGMLITNITNNYIVLLSHPQLNEFIIHNYDYSNEETQEYYVNFIRMLSQKVTKDNINLFFNQKYNFFPILLYSQNFYNSPNTLTRTTTHNILLGILKNVNQSPQENILKIFLTSYPFLQILINHISFFKELLYKWSNDQEQYKEYLLDMTYLFQDLYALCDYLVEILDNLFIQLIILPLFQNLGKLDLKVKTQSLFILHQLITLQLGKELLNSIFQLLIASYIPLVPQFQIQVNYLPTKDPELQNICAQFFPLAMNSSQQNSPLEQSLFVALKKMNPLNFFQIDCQRISEYRKFSEYNLTNKISMNKLFLENMDSSEEYSYNQYNIYAILNSLNSEHYSLILSLIELVIHNPKVKQMSFNEKIVHIMNIITIILEDGNNNNINTIDNCIKSVTIIIEMLTDDFKEYFITYTRAILIKKIEQNLQSDTVNYYRYYNCIVNSINQHTLSIFYNIRESHQIIRYLLLLNINFQKGWIKSQLQPYQFNFENSNQEYNGGAIKLIAQKIILQDLELEISEWIIMEKQEKYMKLINLINQTQTQEVQFWNEDDCNKCFEEINERHQKQEQHAIPQIIAQLHKLYYDQ